MARPIVRGRICHEFAARSALRVSYVGITGIILELCGRIALTAVRNALAQVQAWHSF